MRLKVKFLGLDTGGKPAVVINKDDADELAVRSLGRVRVNRGRQELVAIVNTTTTVIKKGFVGISEDIKLKLNVKEDDEVEIEVTKFPISLAAINNKLKGRKLAQEEILEIIKDVVDGNLSEIEIAAFVTALHLQGLDIDEAASMTLAMVETGRQLQINRKLVVDKHSVGGVPGDKTSLIVVPIVAAAGFAIPKTSSRAITSAAGSADRAEVLMPVDIGIEEMKRVVEKTNGCIAWGGALHLAPADDIFIQVEYPLSIDPLLLPSIMAKKKAVGANIVAIDIPTGRGTKIKTIGDANLLAKDFINLGRKLNMKIQCGITFGEQPIGYAVGAGMEAREALEVLMREKNVPDLIDKATHVAGIIFEMAGKKDGRKYALEILKSGKAEEKLREIIMEQGGDEEIKPQDIEIGEFGIDFVSERNGIVLWIENSGLVEIARAAGSPKDTGAGVQLYKKIGDKVIKGEKVFTVKAEKPKKLERVRELLEENQVYGIGDRMEMLIHEVKEVQPQRKHFILER